jgi:hypothetical protein
MQRVYVHSAEWNGWDHEWWVDKHSEEGGYSLFEGTIPACACRDQAK